MSDKEIVQRGNEVARSTGPGGTLVVEFSSEQSMGDYAVSGGRCRGLPMRSGESHRGNAFSNNFPQFSRPQY